MPERVSVPNREGAMHAPAVWKDRTESVDGAIGTEKVDCEEAPARPEPEVKADRELSCSGCAGVHGHLRIHQIEQEANANSIFSSESGG